jgi:hypothetical protein
MDGGAQEPYIDPDDDSDEANSLRELLALEAEVGVLAGSPNPRNLHRTMVENINVIECAANWAFGPWFPLEEENISMSFEGGSPNLPGIYDIGLSTPVPYLNGESEIIYIGRGGDQRKGNKDTIAKSLSRHVSNGCGSEKWLRLHRPDRQIVARFAIAKDAEQANIWEKLRFRWFLEQFWSLPIGNISAGAVPTEPMPTFELVKIMQQKWEITTFE